VARFFCLRLVLGPVVEAVVLRDRAAWLAEHGHAAELHALFDPVLSPRNMALTAIKRDGPPVPASVRASP
jgi:hypothetical protein